jgi:hypothetical protein
LEAPHISFRSLVSPKGAQQLSDEFASEKQPKSNNKCSAKNNQCVLNRWRGFELILCHGSILLE